MILPPPSRRQILALAATPALLVLSPLAWADGRLRRWICPNTECRWVYDPAIGDHDGGVPPGVPFEDLPESWICPVCGLPHYHWLP